MGRVWIGGVLLMVSSCALPQGDAASEGSLTAAPSRDGFLDEWTVENNSLSSVDLRAEDMQFQVLSSDGTWVKVSNPYGDREALPAVHLQPGDTARVGWMPREFRDFLADGSMSEPFYDESFQPRWPPGRYRLLLRDAHGVVAHAATFLWFGMSADTVLAAAALVNQAPDCFSPLDRAQYVYFADDDTLLRLVRSSAPGDRHHLLEVAFKRGTIDDSLIDMFNELDDAQVAEVARYGRSGSPQIEDALCARLMAPFLESRPALPEAYYALTDLYCVGDGRYDSHLLVRRLSANLDSPESVNAMIGLFAYSAWWHDDYAQVERVITNLCASRPFAACEAFAEHLRLAGVPVRAPRCRDIELLGSIPADSCAAVRAAYLKLVSRPPSTPSFVRGRD